MVERQKVLPVIYVNIELSTRYRIDLLVNGQVILELKAVDDIAPIHKAQLMTYLQLSGLKFLRDW